MIKTLGIDLGTTNTVGAIESEVLRYAEGKDQLPVIPSVVAFPPGGHAPLVGLQARRRRGLDPKNTIFSSKRIIGHPLSSPEARKFRRQYPFDLVEAADGTAAFRTRAGTFSPVDIASSIIGTLLGTHRIAPERVRCVITVPTGFGDAPRRATLEAARRVGLREVSLLDEPVATAIAYRTIQAEGHRMVAVYDLGGGTFDLAIVDCSAGEPRVVTHAGDAYLGGDDLDNAIADWVAAQVLEKHGWDLCNDPLVFDRLVGQCERAKVRLTFANQAVIDIGQVDAAAPLQGERVVLDRGSFVELCYGIVSRTFLICDQVLRDASLKAQDIDAVYLAGGCTSLPVVRDGVAHYFGALPRCELDPMEVVAIGASLRAEHEQTRHGE
jgi:molecular chaperone DnaK